MRAILLGISALTLMSCDDSGKHGVGNVDPDPQFELAGLYEDVSVSARESGAVVRTAMIQLEGGGFYVARGTDNPFVVSEVFQGDSYLDGANFISMNLRYFNPQYQFSGDGRIEAALDEITGNIAGSMNHLVSREQVQSISPRGLYTGPALRLDSINVTRNAEASEEVQVSSLQGSYSGSVNSAGIMLPASIAINDGGGMVISLENGCGIEGDIEAAIGAGIVDASSNSDCAGFTSVQYSGVVGRFGGQLVAILVDASRETALIIYFG